MTPGSPSVRRFQLGQAQPMRHSVIRRSLYNGIFLVAGHAFYYVLVIATNAVLDPVGFGRFYLGWSILNILAAPGGVLALSLSGYFADAFRIGGASRAMAALRHAATTLLPWTVATVAGLELVLLVAGRALGADTIILIVLLPLTAVASVMVETVRAVFQGMLRFVWFGASWLAWCFLQLACGGAALLMIRTPWAVFAGMLAANTATLIVLLIAAGRSGRAAAATQGEAAVPTEDIAHSLRRVLPFCTALGGFVVLNNADVLLAYLTLTGAGVGAYSASALLPKAIVTATHAVSQVILPVATHIRGDGANLRVALIKAVALTFALATLGVLALWLISGAACGGRLGLRFCDPALLLLLAAAAIAVSVIRTTAIIDLIGGHRWRAHVAILGCIAFAAACWLARPDAMRLALTYSLVCWLLLGIVALAALVASRRTARAPIKEGSPP